MTDLLGAIFTKILNFLAVGPPWTRKKLFVLIALALVCVILFSVVWFYKQNEELRNLRITIEQLRSEKEQLETNIIDLKSKLGVLGSETERKANTQKNAVDFKRDWDTSSFDTVDEDTFCPKNKGGNNFQRIIYRYDTPLTLSNLSLKFQMVDQNSKIADYIQRVVVGIKLDDAILSEYDIPTRDNAVVNFRVASDNDELIPGGDGKSISSPIEDKSTINIGFHTQLKHGQEITQVIDIDYISAVPEYGGEKKSISYDTKVNDSRPETARGNLFIGSYIGGCIEIISWYAS
jgi:hypothetical protein